MKNGITLHFVTLTVLVFNRAWAQVTLDGTLGRAGTLPGPDYQIGADVGQQHGGNLFHSFQDFNLQSHESATFSGPDNVQNVISRVTGGNPSSIDGTLRSTIPNADLYFLNPYGIMFGPNAKLDVQGGFHASTADYLRLQDGGRFEARYPNNSLLTVAPVEAFGFLTDTPAFIKTQDSQLEVPNGKTFSWIGGGLEFNGSTPLSYDENGNTVTSSWLLAKSGRLNLASVASRGEVIPTPEGLDLTTSTKGGLLTATNTFFSTSSEAGGGQVWIRAGQFQMTQSQIENNTVDQAAGDTNIQADNVTFEDGASIGTSTNGTGAGGSINLKVANDLTLRGNDNNGGNSWLHAYTTSSDEMPQAGAAGNILIQARNVNLADGAEIGSITWGTGQSGTVHLQVSETLEATNGQIYADSYNYDLEKAGNAGDVIIQARQINLTDSFISSETRGTGQSGTVHLQVSETLNIAKNSYVSADTNNFDLEKAGNAGNVIIQARNVNLTDGAQITSGTGGTGQGGEIHLQLSETLTATGATPDEAYPSGLFSGSYNENQKNAGNAGNLIIQARNVKLSDGAHIASSTFSTGQGGTVHLQVSEAVTVTGVTPTDVYASTISAQSNTDNSGNAGNVLIQARDVKVADGGTISSGTGGTSQGGTVYLQIAGTLIISGESPRGYHSAVSATSSDDQLEKAGAAGNVEIHARQIVVRDGGVISSRTLGTGPGGSIHLQVADSLTVSGQDTKGIPSSISVASLNANDIQSGTTSIKEGLQPGDAGSLSIQANTLNVIAGGKLTTQTNNAGGGDITLLSPNLLYLQNGQITTSVKGGKSNGGNITINTPVFVILASAKIIAQADEGKGGNIMIRANQFIATPPPDSLVSASSRLGIDGQVVISSPDPNISGKLFLVSTKGLDVTNQLKRPCGSAKSLEEIMNPRFKFYVYPIAGSRQSFEDWGPSPLPSRSVSSSNQGKTGKGSAPGRGKPTTETVAQAEYQPVALVVECPKEEKGG